MTQRQHAGRLALITGGAGGIGRQIAETLALEQGASVCIVDRDATTADEVAKLIADKGGKASTFIADLATPSAVPKLLAEVAARHGMPDILVNNAAIAATHPAGQYPLEHWTSTFAINVTAPMLLIQSVLEAMKAKRWGRIVNIASISGVRAGTGRLAYGTSKAALIALTRQFAIETAELGITVNAVAPGPVETEMVRVMHGGASQSTYGDMLPMRRYGTAAEISAAVSFLASDAASFVTGHTLAVDGGFLASGLLVRNMFDVPA